MNFNLAKKMLEDKHFLISYSTLQNSWKRTRSHDFRFESIFHYISKAYLVYLINKKSQKGNQQGACSEFTFPSGRRVDVLHLINKDKEIVGYEIQTSTDKKKPYPEGVTMIEIDLTKAPERVLESFKILEEYFKKYVV